MSTHKDYYRILQVTPDAGMADIKKSFRQLALKYHPDKNFGDKLSEAKFKEIQEAYQVLSDPGKRQEYNYQRARQYAYSQHQRPSTPPPATAVGLLNQVIAFRKKIAQLDPYRMNKAALFKQIQHFLSRQHLQVLRQYNDPAVNRRIIEELLFCSKFLPFSHIEKICLQLTALAGTDNAIYTRIYKFSREMRIKSVWEKYKLIVALTVVGIICILIYLLSMEPTY